MAYFKQQNIEADNNIRDLINLVKKELLYHLGNRVISLILRGSFARREGSWKDVDGKLIITSDLDLLLITKVGTSISRQLRSRINKLEKESGIIIDLHICSYFMLRFYKKDLWLFDTKQTGIVLYGKDIRRTLKVMHKHINAKDITALFFNRIYSSIEKCSPDDFTSNNHDSLERLSHIASSILFTCIDPIVINSGNYHYSLFKRTQIFESIMNDTNINVYKGNFLMDLNSALNFKFYQANSRYLESASIFCLAAINHFISLLQYFMEHKYNTKNTFIYLCLEGKSHSLKDKAFSFLTHMLIGYRLLKIRRLPRIYRTIHPHIYCRMASLMLFMALGKKSDYNYLIKGNEYLLKIFSRRGSDKNTKVTWVTLRDELKLLHRSGIF